MPKVVIVIPAVYPHLVDLAGKLNLRYKSGPTQLRISKLRTNFKLRTFSWLSRVPQSKFEANWSRGSRVMIRQTNREYNFKNEDNDLVKKVVKF